MPEATFRYQLPRKAIKGDCPNCGPKHRRTLSRYVDTRTGEPLPDTYGRCDWESNCGYHLNPYQKGPSGLSYHDEIKARYSIKPIPKEWFTIAAKQKHKGVSKQGIITNLIQVKSATLEQAERVAAFLFDQPPARSAIAVLATEKIQVFTIPEEVVDQSLGHYERNQFAYLLRRHFGG